MRSMGGKDVVVHPELEWASQILSMANFSSEKG